MLEPPGCSRIRHWLKGRVGRNFVTTRSTIRERDSEVKRPFALCDEKVRLKWTTPKSQTLLVVAAAQTAGINSTRSTGILSRLSCCERPVGTCRYHHPQCRSRYWPVPIAGICACTAERWRDEPFATVAISNIEAPRVPRRACGAIGLAVSRVDDFPLGDHSGFSFDCRAFAFEPERRRSCSSACVSGFILIILRTVSSRSFAVS